MLLIKYFNNKLSSSLEIQLSDLRSVVMKEACKIASLCAKELGLTIEQGIVQLLTQNCLFKIAGSANQVISESASKCILNILRYVHSIKVISNICEIRSMKANNVRILCAQSLVNIMSFYDTGLIVKAKVILEETIKILLVDANAEVRATTRKAFILYKNMFNPEGQKIFEKLGKSVQKQILEDEKNFVESNINFKPDRKDNLMKTINALIDENLKQFDYNELIENKPKTPVFNNLFKNRSSKDLPKNEKNDINKKRTNSKIKKINNYIIEKDKKEETVKYINVDDDDIVENDDDFEDDKKRPEESNDINMVFNYDNTLKKGKNTNKKSFIKKNQLKINDNFKNIDEKIPKDNKRESKINKLSQSHNINPFMKNNADDANNIIDDLIVNQEKKNEINLNADNIQFLANKKSNLTPGSKSKPESNKNKNNNSNINHAKGKSKKQSNDNSEKPENYTNSNIDKKRRKNFGKN